MAFGLSQGHFGDAPIVNSTATGLAHPYLGLFVGIGIVVVPVGGGFQDMWGSRGRICPLAAAVVDGVEHAPVPSVDALRPFGQNAHLKSQRW